MRTFDSLHTELNGWNLVEASAGTGKTYAIASLYLRLLVEKGLLPEQILVVTFTEAATKELRDRIRSRIRQARDACSGRGEADELISAMLESGAPWRELAPQRLEAALQTFDCAAITTIHGFCHRVLQDFAFESGSLYEMELSADQDRVVQGLVDDYWRRTFFGVQADLLPLALARRWSPEYLTRFLKGKLSNPLLQIMPSFTPEQIREILQCCRRAWSEVAALWPTGRSQVAQLLAEHKGVSRSADNYHPDLLPSLLQAMDRYLEAGNPFDIFDGLHKFTSSHLESQRLKRHDPPQHPLFQACQLLEDCLHQAALTILWGAYQHVSSHLPIAKSQHNLRFYDDLLIDLYRALQGPEGGVLAQRIGGGFQAALIDEFQDTDQVQFRIFRHLFPGQDKALFLIGDPKQAIYSFRGADIFAYLEARKGVPTERHFTMDRNWRSTPLLVEAVNRFFTQAGKRPLLLDSLHYPVVTAARPGQPLVLEQRDSAPLQLWFMGRGGDDTKVVPLGTATARIVESVTGEIAGLLADAAQGTATLEGRPLEPGDLAVIVRSHPQARLVYESLLTRGIPAVIRSNASIFASDEAGELCSVLAAVLQPGREARVRAALATRILGYPGERIAHLCDPAGEAEWEQRLGIFRDYHDLWYQWGFMAMFRSLLDNEGVRGRLLCLPAGERRLTNLLHCAELLHAEESSSRLGMDALYTWFGEKVCHPPEGEEHQIRLESDEKAVRILTMHVSKGLEFPVVFCPFCWSGVMTGEHEVVCHEGGGTVADYGSEDLERHRRLARQEALAENLRLLYVALTRARYRCYLAWGRFRHVESSAMAYLLHTPPPGEADLLAALETVFDKISDSCMLLPLQRLQTAAPALISLVVDPGPGQMVDYTAPLQTEGQPVCRQLQRPLESDWRVASFTWLAGGHGHKTELPDYDGQTTLQLHPVESIPAEGSMFAFPRGAEAGTFLHGIFEELDFACSDQERLRQQVAAALRRSSFDQAWLEPLCGMVREVLQAPLGSEQQPFRLADLQPGTWLAEMEFYFPLARLGSRELASVLKRHGEGAAPHLHGLAEQLNFRETTGMLRGFIDLVFAVNGRYYILDWKSNHLGNRFEDYHQTGLAREMAARQYHLQYLLYSVALHRYLGIRLPGYRYQEHFGGVLYLFLRGIDRRQPGCGVYFDTPCVNLIQDLTKVLMDVGGE